MGRSERRLLRKSLGYCQERVTHCVPSTDTLFGASAILFNKHSDSRVHNYSKIQGCCPTVSIFPKIMLNQEKVWRVSSEY